MKPLTTQILILTSTVKAINILNNSIYRISKKTVHLTTSTIPCRIRFIRDLFLTEGLVHSSGEITATLIITRKISMIDKVASQIMQTTVCWPSHIVANVVTKCKTKRACTTRRPISIQEQSVILAIMSLSTSMPMRLSQFKCQALANSNIQVEESSIQVEVHSLERLNRSISLK